MPAGSATGSDDSQRRNCFNKVAVNRQIIGAWLAGAAERGLSLAPLTGGPTGPIDPQAQLTHMIDIDERFNARR